MPLIRSTDYLRVDSNIHEEIADGEFYDLRRLLNWRQLDNLSKMKVVKIQAPNMFGATQNRAEKMDVSFDMTTVHKAMLETYLVGWSHPDPINSETIDSIDPITKDALIEIIEDLQKAQLGVQLDVPKDASLNGSANGTPKVLGLHD